MFHSTPSEGSSSSCETHLQEYHKGCREICIRIFTILPILHILANVTIVQFLRNLCCKKLFAIFFFNSTRMYLLIHTLKNFYKLLFPVCISTKICFKMSLPQTFSEKYFWHRRSWYEPLKSLQKGSEYLDFNC